MNQFRQFRSDAEAASFIAEQVQYISPRIIETVFGEPEWQKFIPMETGGNPAVKEFGFDLFTAAGMAEVFEGNGRNLPTVAGSRERILSRVFEIGINRELSDSDLEAASYEAQRARAFGLQPFALDEALERAAAQEVAMRHDDIAVNGLPSHNIVGLLGQPNIGDYPVPAGAGGSALWEDKTGPEIVADMAGLVSLVMTTAKVSQFYPDMLVLPTDKYLIASTKQMTGTSDTALTFFQKTNPMGARLKVESWHRLNGAGAGGTGRAFCYKYDQDVLSNRVPRLYYIHLPPAREPAGWTWTHSGRTAGVAVKRPFAVGSMDGF